MNKFTRIDRQATEPKARDSRVYGQAVSIGEPLQIQAAQDLHEQIESSLERIAKERLVDAENRAQAKAKAILDEAHAKAKLLTSEILEKANAQAKAMLQSAQDQESSIRENAHEEGFKAGFQEGYTDATMQMEQETVQLIESTKTLLESAYKAEQRVLQDFEQHAVKLIEHLTFKILHRELSESPETILQMVQKAADALYLSGKVRVVIHPQILQEIRQFSAQADAMLESLHRFEWIADPVLDLHQVYIIGQDASFELSPETQVHSLLEPLKSALELPRPEIQEPIQAESLSDTSEVSELPEESPFAKNEQEALPETNVDESPSV